METSKSSGGSINIEGGGGLNVDSYDGGGETQCNSLKFILSMICLLCFKIEITHVQMVEW